jgi:large conductance mechanosensitive channel
MWSEFRSFVLRGNVIELAVAFVLGTAFASVVMSFTNGILLPLTGLLGWPDFNQMVVIMPNGAFLLVGGFVTTLINFVLIAAVVFFFVVKPVNALESRREKLHDLAQLTKSCPYCATEIPQAAMRCPNCTSEL